MVLKSRDVAISVCFENQHVGVGLEGVISMRGMKSVGAEVGDGGGSGGSGEVWRFRKKGAMMERDGVERWGRWVGWRDEADI